MNSYLLAQLAEARHQDFITEARRYHRAQLARPTARFYRRGSIRSSLRMHAA